MITKDNYEAMLLQYHEGLLDARQRAEVEAFLQQHPDIEQEYRLYYSNEPIVTPPDARYMHKRSIKQRPVSAIAWQHWAAAACIAVLFATAVWLWSPSQPGSNTTSSTGHVASAEPATAVATADSSTPAVEPRMPEYPATARERHTAVASVAAEPETIQADATPVEHFVAAASEQTPVCESDKLVVYGCRVENRQNLVATPDAPEPCNSLACRLRNTGQKMGML